MRNWPKMDKPDATPIKLDEDLGNAFNIISYRLQFLENPAFGEVKLQSLPTFEEYLEERRKAGYRPDEIEKYRKNSMPQAIVAYDALVQEFNAAISAIQDDPAKLREYLRRFQELIYGKKK